MGHVVHLVMRRANNAFLTIVYKTRARASGQVFLQVPSLLQCRMASAEQRRQAEEVLLGTLLHSSSASRVICQLLAWIEELRHVPIPEDLERHVNIRLKPTGYQ